MCRKTERIFEHLLKKNRAGRQSFDRGRFVFYSLYLTHEIVFLLLPEFFALKIVFSKVFARLFYLMFEKPFLNISGGGRLAENAATAVK